MQENKEIEVIKRVPMVFNPALIDPNESKLNAMVESVKDITADPQKITKEELVTVSDTRNKLVKMRTHVERVLKAEREEAKDYQKDVIAYEKKLIGIIEPEEIRLKKIEADTKAFNIRKVRLEKLPEMRARLASISIALNDNTCDEFLLTMDPNEFEEYYNNSLTSKLEADRLALEAQKRKELEEQEIRATKIKEAQEAEAKKLQAQKDELEKARVELEHQKELEETRIKAQKQAIEDGKIALEQKAKDEEEAAKKLKMEQIEAKKKQEADEKYQNWLKENGWTEDTEDQFYVETYGNAINLYKKVSEFKK